MAEAVVYDAGIIGGGLAGLALSIQLARAGYSVILWEKETYPYHKVCGEYISMESWGFLESLGLPLSAMQLPRIDKLTVSAPDGSLVESPLGLGGFGISRYTLDAALAEIARKEGVNLLEGVKVTDVIPGEDTSTISAAGVNYRARVVAGTFGKRSNLDVKWGRDFVKRKPGKLNNYIGVKYHVRSRQSAGTISLHNFADGYCGISEIEDGKYCLCYLTTASNLKLNNNSIAEMEENVLKKNPLLHAIFSEAEFLYEAPITISQVSFDKKSQVQDHILMTGDAAGMITPLCGNGMSMALHGSKIAFECIDGFLQDRTDRAGMEESYRRMWDKQFSVRLRTGRMIQSLFGRESVTNLFIRVIKYFPFIVRKLIRSTHGEPF